MKKIVIVGLIGNHHTLYEHLLSITSEHFDKVSFITSSNINKEIHLKKSNIDIIIDNEEVFDVLKNQIKFINEHNVLILDEYFDRYYRLLGIKFKPFKKILIIHNSNKWNKIIYNPFNNIKSFIDQFFRKNITKQFNAFVTLGPNIQKHFLSLNSKKPVFFLPFVYSEKFNNREKISSKKINLLIPGMISNKRRNYKDLLDSYESYLAKNPNSNIIFTLLGRIASNDDKFISEQCDRINKNYGQKIKYWNTFINQKEFNLEVTNSDYIFSNIYSKKLLNGIIEYYGKSKGTGISYVFYQSTKPGIIPDFQNILEGFDSQFIRFDKYCDLNEIFSNLDENNFNQFELERNAINNSERFNVLINKEKDKFIQYLTE